MNLSKMRDGRLHTEQLLPGSLIVVVTDGEDDRHFSLNINSLAAARELVSGLLIQFPELQ